MHISQDHFRSFLVLVTTILKKVRIACFPTFLSYVFDKQITKAENIRPQRREAVVCEKW